MLGLPTRDGCYGVQTHVILLLDSIEGAQILQEDQLTPGGQDGGNAGGDDTGLVHINTGGGGNGAVLTDSTHVLTQAGVHQPVVEGSEEADQGEGHGGQTNAAVDLVAVRSQ